MCTLSAFVVAALAVVFAAGRDFDGRRIKSLERRLARLERRIKQPGNQVSDT